jgi:hypothetical protein
MNLPPIPAGGFQGRKVFQNWLRNLDKPDLIALAPILIFRAAMRKSVFLKFETNKKSSKYVLSVLRCFFTIQSSYNSKLLLNELKPAFAYNRAANIYLGDQHGVVYATQIAISPSAFFDSFVDGAYAISYAIATLATNVPASDATIWNALTNDATALINGIDPKQLVNMPLWLNDTPNWWLEQFETLKSACDTLSKTDAQKTGWLVWMDWLQSRFDGSPEWGLSQLDLDEILPRIGTGDNRENFWDRDPEVINTEIASWLTAKGWRVKSTPPTTTQLDFFLSYQENDKTVAELISETLEGAGYSVFSQFNDLKTGDFRGDIAENIEKADRFIAVYSPDYFESEWCKEELKFALKKYSPNSSKKIIPFTVKKCVVPKDFKVLGSSLTLHSIIHTSLYHLPAEEKKTKILEIVNVQVTPQDRVAQRQAAQETVSSNVMLDPNGRVGVGKNELYDQVHADNDLFNLPRRMLDRINQLKILLAPKNAAQSIQLCLDDIYDELLVNDVNCSIGLLKDNIIQIKLDLENGNGEFLKDDDNYKQRFNTLFDLYDKMVSHYPLDQEREKIYASSDIEMKSPEIMQNEFEQLNANVQAGYDAGIFNEDFVKAAKSRIRITNDSLKIPDVILRPSDDPEFDKQEQERSQNVQNYKKRSLVQLGAFSDKTVDVASKIVAISDSPTTQKVIGLFKKIADFIWN